VSARIEDYALIGDCQAAALARASKSWLARLITRRVPLERWSEALEHRKGDIKVIVDFTQ